MQKELYQQRIEDAQDRHHGDGVAHHPGGLLRLPCAQGERKAGGTSDADEQDDGQTDGGQGIGHIGGRIAQIAHTLPNEDLVHNVVQRADQHGDDAGDGEAAQQFGQRLIPQWITEMILHIPLPFRSD